MKKKHYDEKYDKNKSSKYKQLYDKNKAFSRQISEKELDILINYCAEKNYYNLVTNNCALVAARAWNKAFGKKEFKVKVAPSALKKQIKKLDGSFTYDIYKRVLGISL